MMPNKFSPFFRQKRVHFALILFVSGFFAVPFLMPETLHARESIGTVIAVKEKVYVLRSGKEERLSVQRGDDILLADTYETEAGARAKLLFMDDSLVTLGERTQLRITESIYKPAKKQRSSIMHLLAGSARALVGKNFSNAKSKFEIHTPTTIVAAKGTYFIVKFCEEEELCSEVFNLSQSSMVAVLSKNPSEAQSLEDLSGGLEVTKLAKRGAPEGESNAGIETGNSGKQQSLEIRPHEIGVVKRGKGIVVLAESSPEYTIKLNKALSDTRMKESPLKGISVATLQSPTPRQIAKLEFASNLPGDDCGRGILPHLTSLLATSTASLLGQCESSSLLIIQQLPPLRDISVGSSANTDVTLGVDFQ